MENQISRWEKFYLNKRRWLLLLLIVAVLVWYIYGIVQERNRAERYVEEQFLKKMNEVHFRHTEFAIMGLEGYLSEGGSEFEKRRDLEWVAKCLEGVALGNYMDDFGRYYHYVDEKSDFYPDVYEELFTTYASLVRMWSESEELPERASVELFREEITRLRNFFKVSDTGEIDPEGDSQVAGRTTYRHFRVAISTLVEQIEFTYIKENLSVGLYYYAMLEPPYE
ncbi:hypothetical protein ACR6HW_13095 [Fusibacter sp. JL298sf-3]